MSNPSNLLLRCWWLNSGVVMPYTL